MKKSPVVKVIIRICVILMIGSTIGVYVAYIFSPSTDVADTTENENTEVTQTTSNDENESELIIPEINTDNPEESSAPILITEDGEIDEMDQTIEVSLSNGQTELVRLGDLGDAIEID